MRGYPPIGGYALIGDCHSAALVSRSSSIDWCCLPRFDSDAVRAETPHDADAIERHLSETLAWWRDWSGKLTHRGRPGVCIVRSALVLKALTYAPSGAIVAAPTTSLPEDPGGERNWDYRFSWIRDSVFTVRALAALGCAGEADGFRRFIQRSAAGNADELQVVYGIDGKRRVTEVTLDHLEGWRGSRPVRVGNAADKQFQSDTCTGCC